MNERSWHLDEGYSYSILFYLAANGVTHFPDELVRDHKHQNVGVLGRLHQVWHSQLRRKRHRETCGPREDCNQTTARVHMVLRQTSFLPRLLAVCAQAGTSRFHAQCWWFQSIYARSPSPQTPTFSQSCQIWNFGPCCFPQFWKWQNPCRVRGQSSAAALHKVWRKSHFLRYANNIWKWQCSQMGYRVIVIFGIT